MDEPMPGEPTMCLLDHKHGPRCAPVPGIPYMETAFAPFAWQEEKARIGSCVARRALSRLVRVSHACSFVVGIVAGVLVGRL